MRNRGNAYSSLIATVPYLRLQFRILSQAPHLGRFYDRRCFGLGDVPDNEQITKRKTKRPFGLSGCARSRQRLRPQLESRHKVKCHACVGLLGAGYLRFAVWQLVEPLVGFHVEGHVASLTFEARFVPHLQIETETREEKINVSFQCKQQLKMTTTSTTRQPTLLSQ